MKKLTAMSLALAALLTGCWGRELTDVTLLQTMTVDGSGPVELTAVAGGEEEGVYRVQGSDVAAAQQALPALGSTRLELTHIRQLVLGPEVDVPETLWQALTHRESGYGATVWLAGGPSAGALLEGEGDVPARLRSLEDNAGVAAPTVLEALSALWQTGQVRLPVLERSGGELTVTGYQTVEVK